MVVSYSGCYRVLARKGPWTCRNMSEFNDYSMSKRHYKAVSTLPKGQNQQFNKKLFYSWPPNAERPLRKWRTLSTIIMSRFSFKLHVTSAYERTPRHWFSLAVLKVIILYIRFSCWTLLHRLHFMTLLAFLTFNNEEFRISNNLRHNTKMQNVKKVCIIEPCLTRSWVS